VLFAHGSGGSRHSPRNRYVAGELNRARLATVLADLLTREEEQVDIRTAALRFDIDLLAMRAVVSPGFNDARSLIETGKYVIDDRSAGANINPRPGRRTNSSNSTATPSTPNGIPA
jgi:hypothetical protein